MGDAGERGGGSVTTAQSGPGTASLGDPAAKHTNIHPILLTVAGMVTLETSLERYPTPKTRNPALAWVSLFNPSSERDLEVRVANVRLPRSLLLHSRLLW